jgi:ABC-type glycerol-3-phosphate transport system substrate-binding protein
MKNTLKIAILAFGVAVMAAACKGGAEGEGSSTATSTATTAPVVEETPAPVDTAAAPHAEHADSAM